jgi:hypothetical protein
MRRVTWISTTSETTQKEPSGTLMESCRMLTEMSRSLQTDHVIAVQDLKCL